MWKSKLNFILVPVAGIVTLTAASAGIAQNTVSKIQLAPERSVMSVRLEGTWNDGKGNDYIFEPIGPSITRVRVVEQGTNNELRRVTLESDLKAGLMKGSYRIPDSRYAAGYRMQTAEVWVTDTGYLSSTGLSFSSVRYTRLPIRTDPAAAAAWTGQWKTNRGLLTVNTDGVNFFAWITQPGSEQKDRVAFRATSREAIGAWDSEWDRFGTWRHVPMQWGDLKLTLSADGNSFTGTYSTTKATMGMETREWTGERVDKIKPPASTEPPPSREPLPSRSTHLPKEPTQAPPAPATPAPPRTPAPVTDPIISGQANVGFKRVGAFEVRLDKVAAEDGRYWHVYMTLRNASTDTLVQAQGLTVRFEDSDGVGVETRQAVRAKPGYPELFGSPPPTTRPGGTLPVKFVFDKKMGARPSRVIVFEGEASAEFGFN